MRAAVKPRELVDRLLGQAGDACRPSRIAARQMRLELVRHIGVLRHVAAVGIAFLEQHMHDGAGERRIGAGAHGEVEIGDLGRRRPIGIDDDELGAARLSRLGHVGHQIDLGGNRIAAPDDDEIALRHLAAIDAALDPGPGVPSGIRQHYADGRELARIAHGMTQPVDAVALHQPHRPGVEIGPHRLASVALRRADERFGHRVERSVPRDLLERRPAYALVADPAQWHAQPPGMVLAFGITGDLGADDPRSVAVRRRAADAPDRVGIDALDLERTGARAIVRTDRGQDIERHGSG